jgi:hypothetical protein
VEHVGAGQTTTEGDRRRDGKGRQTTRGMKVNIVQIVVNNTPTIMT